MGLKKKVKEELDWMSDDLLYLHIVNVYSLKDLVWEECTKEEYFEPYPRTFKFKDHCMFFQDGKPKFFRVVLGRFLHDLSPELVGYLEERKPYWYKDIIL